MSKSVLSIFSYKNFIVSGLTFRSSIHLKFIFAFISIALGDWPKKISVQFMSEGFAYVLF